MRGASSRAKVDFTDVLFRYFQGYRNPWYTSNTCFHRRGDRAGIGHVMAQVSPDIDPGDHQVNRFFKISQAGQGHTVGRRAIAGISRDAISQLQLTHA